MGHRYQDDGLAGELGKGTARPAHLAGFQHRVGARTVDDPVSSHLNAATKYVTSTTLADTNAWQNPVLLRGAATRAVAERTADANRDLSVIGSAALVRALPADGLVDRRTLLVHPLVPGAGRCLSDGTGPLTEFTLTGVVASTKGVLIAHHERR